MTARSPRELAGRCPSPVAVIPSPFEIDPRKSHVRSHSAEMGMRRWACEDGHLKAFCPRRTRQVCLDRPGQNPLQAPLNTSQPPSQTLSQIRAFSEQ